MPDVISGVIIALADTQLTFSVGKVTKKSRNLQAFLQKSDVLPLIFPILPYYLYRNP